MNFKSIRYESISFNRIVADKSYRIKLGLHHAISLTDSFLFTPGHSVNFKSMPDRSQQVSVES